MSLSDEVAITADANSGGDSGGSRHQVSDGEHLRSNAFGEITMGILKSALVAVVLVFFATTSTMGMGVDHSAFAALLTKYSDATGVNYRAWHATDADRQAVADILRDYGEVRSNQLDSSERQALLINLYNAAMIKAVLDHYPIGSVQEIGSEPFSIFRKRWIVLDGEKVSLDRIEKGILLKEYRDPRLHFAVNCASLSCPPLRPEPYQGAILDDQLDEQARLFAASPFAARVDDDRRRIDFSELFKWYQADFGVSNPADYLNRYRDVALPTDYRIAWQDYDWSLNESRK
jgi:hypothetical protein